MSAFAVAEIVDGFEAVEREQEAAASDHGADVGALDADLGAWLSGLAAEDDVLDDWPAPGGVAANESALALDESAARVTPPARAWLVLDEMHRAKPAPAAGGADVVRRRRRRGGPDGEGARSGSRSGGGADAPPTGTRRGRSRSAS